MAAALVGGRAGLAGADAVQIGTTYSHKQCTYFGLDWKKVYLATLDLKFDLIRLGAYWDEVEPSEGQEEFEQLDWQIQQARARAIPVMLTVGMKAPRWPEYFIPPWVLKQVRVRKGAEVSAHARVRTHTLRFVERVVTRYRHDPIIQWWQVENEPFDRAGPAHWRIGREFVEQEVALVRALDDRRRPVVLNAATHPHGFLRFLARFFSREDPVTEALRLGDLLGLNVYLVIGHQWRWKTSYYRTQPAQRLRYLSRVRERAARAGKPVWVTELQAEPWEPGHLVYRERAEPLTSSPAMLPVYVKELRSLEIPTILLWGVEYWYFRKVHYDDPAWWETVSDLLRRRRPDGRPDG